MSTGNPAIWDFLRTILLLSVIAVSVREIKSVTDWTFTKCELFDQYPSEENMQDWVWCINSTTVYTLKNSDKKTALCCTEEVSDEEFFSNLASLYLPLILAIADFPVGSLLMMISCIFVKMNTGIDKEANKNKPLDAAAQGHEAEQGIRLRPVVALQA